MPLSSLDFFYVSKKVVGLSSDLFRAFRVFGLSKLWKTNFRNKYGQWAIVTGCTRGIGKAYVKELATRGMDIVLVGRSIEALNHLAQEIAATYQVQTKVIVSDFAKGPEAFESLRQGLKDLDVGILVNNVGVIADRPKYLTETSEQFLWEMINVNVAVATLMSRLVLPQMELNGRGAIINLASSASYSPQPLVSVYTATKAYVDYFSEALSYEVSGKGVTVQTVNPMYVCTGMTEFSDLLSKPSFFVPTAETFVRQAIQTLGVTHRTTGYWTHSLQLYFAGLAPRGLYIYLSYLMNQAFRKEAMKKEETKKID